MFKAFLSSDGSQQVVLDEIKISCEQNYDWSFTTPADYSYPPTEIEVVAGTAKLVGTPSACSGTPNACNTFASETSCQNQTGCSWTLGAGSCQNIGSCSGLPSNTCNSCGAVGCSKKGNNCSGTLNCSLSTSQTNCNLCNQCAWIVSGTCSGTPNACNTFASETSCQNQTGCSWTPGSYPNTNPAIQPVLSYTVPGIDQWSSFTETATKNGGEIYYQLSYDDGSSWYYWNGSSWSLAGLGNYNPATIVNANLNSFSTSTGKIMFKAFLSSDGSQQVVLDNVRIGWGMDVGAGGYATFGYLESSAFDLNDSSPLQILGWDEDLGACSTCEIQFQLRVAPDNGGNPGIWSGWYGSEGINTYYIDPTEQLLSTELNWRQWVQYRVELVGDGVSTPILSEVRINYK